MKLRQLTLLFMLAMLMTAIFSGCGASGPVGTVKAFTNAVYNGDMDKAAKYVVEDQRGNMDDMGMFGDIMSIPGIKDIMKAMKKNTKYELVSQDGNTAKVKVKVDIAKAMGPLGAMAGDEGVTETIYTLENRNGKWLISDYR